MVSAFTDPYETPIYNYFRAKEDVSWLLKKKKEANKAEMAYLAQVFFELTEWYSKAIAEGEYVHNLDKWKRTFELENKVNLLSKIAFGLRTLNNDLHDKLQLLDNLVPVLHELRCKHKHTVEAQIAEIERVTRILEGQIKIEAPKKHNKDVNWVEQVVVVGNVIGQKINTKETTLAEWVEYIKLASKSKAK
jgi:ribosomal protein L18E